ncbi:MAG: hypothetical protein IJ072_02645 [Oscillospiraceae bacterium]|nr:hypothetical protein [Oscillospiraceae bacterium]
MILKFTASEKDAGRKLYNILRRDMKISATLLRRLKNADGIKLDGVSAFTDRLIQSRQTLTADVTAAEPECDVVPQHGEIEVLYEDAGLLAVNKPAGMIVHPSHAKYTDTLANFVSGYLLDSTGDGRCHSVGRLDRDTGGVVLFAKNSYMKNLASAAMAEGEKIILPWSWAHRRGRGA